MLNILMVWIPNLSIESYRDLLLLKVLFYICKRLLWFVPIFMLVILLLFLIDIRSIDEQASRNVQSNSIKRIEEGTEDARRLELTRLGYQLPPFYFSIQKKGVPHDNLNEFNPYRRKITAQIADLSLNANTTTFFSNQFFSLYEQYRYENQKDAWRKSILEAYQNRDIKKLWIQLLNHHQQEQLQIDRLKQAVVECEANKTWRDAIPAWRWNGINNRFHRFCSQYFYSGSRVSAVDGVAVYKKIWPAVGITLLINCTALTLLILIGIPLGMYLFKKDQKRFSRAMLAILYVMFVLPMFWVATLLLMGAGWFPQMAIVGSPQLLAHEIPNFATFLRFNNMGFLLLPILSIVVSSLAFLAIQMRRAMQAIRDEKYIVAAYTRGITKEVVDRKHIKPNALFTILTVVGNSIPGLISGSIVIETIFNIPGMGRLLWNSLYAFDWNVVLALLLISIVFSVAGQLLTDIAYYFINPTLKHTE